MKKKDFAKIMFTGTQFLKCGFAPTVICYVETGETICILIANVVDQLNKSWTN